MALPSRELRRHLREAGIANAAIDAVWPQWWSSEAEASLSATAELTFTVARRLGLSPRDLLDGDARFVWRDETKYKHLRTVATSEEAALSSFGCAVARAALPGMPGPDLARLGALELRRMIMASGSYVDVLSLLSVSWGLGIPVLYLRVFPLAQKRMHAMTATVRSRAVILLARASSYAAPTTFTLAHELGHVMLGHLSGGSALVDVEDPFRSSDHSDHEETEADRFALELLTGQPEPQVVGDASEFSAIQLAAAVTAQGPLLGIEPGVLAMCAGHTTGLWDRAYGALKVVPPGERDMATAVNEVARAQLDWSVLTQDSRDYLLTVMGLPANV